MTEAQHLAAAMKLVDDPDEQDLLEALLEEGKPPAPRAARGLHPLLAAPFRYDPLRGGSRFRALGDPGVFYGCESVRTAAAELGYWRWKFLRDAPGLERLEPVAHNAFCVDIATTAVDLRGAPFARQSRLWTHPADYSATQAFARVARAAAVGAILYHSVRDPGSGDGHGATHGKGAGNPAWCIALLTPEGFARPRPRGAVQLWFVAVTRETVTWRRDGAALRFPTKAWRARS